MKSIKIKRNLAVFLWLVTIHTIIVGICLIFIPESLMPVFGFEIFSGNFFRAQGGVFHVAMSVVYIIIARNFEKSKELIFIIIIVKMIAAIFLITYYLLINSIYTILFSGIGDFLMGIITLMLYLNYQKSKKKEATI